MQERRDVGIYEFHDVMVVIHRAPVGAEVLAAIGACQRKLRDAHGRIAGLSILCPEALVRPEASVRAAGQVVSDEFDQMAYASAIVLTESGMGGALYRSILTGIHLASRRPVQQKVFSDLGEAIDWLIAKNPESPLASRSADVRRKIQGLVLSNGEVQSKKT